MSSTKAHEKPWESSQEELFERVVGSNDPPNFCWEAPADLLRPRADDCEQDAADSGDGGEEEADQPGEGDDMDDAALMQRTLPWAGGCRGRSRSRSRNPSRRATGGRGRGRDPPPATGRTGHTGSDGNDHRPWRREGSRPGPSVVSSTASTMTARPVSAPSRAPLEPGRSLGCSRRTGGSMHGTASST